MLLQLENNHEEDVSKLLEFAKQNNLKLSLVDEENDYALPGKPLTDQQLQELIETSRKSGVISMKDAHEMIKHSLNEH